MKHDHKYEEDWKQDAPLLASLRGTQPHEAPEGYFDSLPGTLMDRIRASETPGESPLRDPVSIEAIPGRSSFWNWRNISYAAGLALLIGAGLFFLSRSVTTDPQPDASAFAAFEQQLDELNDEDIIDFIELEDLDEEVMAEMMGDEALAAIEAEALGQGGDAYIGDLDWEDLDLESLDLDEIEGLEELLN